jgi:hypothetical protein
MKFITLPSPASKSRRRNCTGRLICPLLALIVFSSLNVTARAGSTEFTYQGHLNAGASPANGSYDLKFSLFDAVTAGNQISSTVTTNAVGVANGVFTVPLDFGVKAFSGPDRWLEISVQPAGGGSFTTLAPRQKMTATPYALALPNLRTEASNNGLSFLSANIIGGSTVNAVAAGVSGAVIAGGGATNGFPQLINANYSVIGGGYSNTVSANGSQSTIAGGVGNSATSGGVTIGGGQVNNASANFATIGGGQSNAASGANSTISGGNTNAASGANSTIPGGSSNVASGQNSFAAGNRAKAIHPGAFVWGDSTSADVSSTADNQMMIRATGGVVLNAGTGVTLPVNATNATAVPVGTLYKDNTIVSWGRVSANGTLGDAFNVASVVRNSAGNYTVTMKASFSGTSLVPVVSVSYIGVQPTTAAAFRIASTNQLLSNTTFNVFINSGTFAAADADFTFIVTGR